MATNPRNKGRKPANTDNEENTVSDTDTTTEAPEAEATPAPEASKEPKEVIDHEGNLFNAIVAFASDSDTPALQEAYRAIPSAARGKAQGVAMKRAMTEGGVDMDVLGNVLDAFNNLPAATKSRATKPQIDEPTLAAVRLAACMVAYDQLRSELGDEAHTQALEWYQGEAPEEHRTLITKVAANVVTASAKGGRGGTGTRNTMSEKLVDLIARGALPEGAVLKGAGEAEATVQADGSVITKGESFTNLSAAARVHRTKEDGKATSTNGWDFWNYEDKPVGELRKS